MTITSTHNVTAPEPKPPTSAFLWMRNGVVYLRSPEHIDPLSDTDTVMVPSTSAGVTIDQADTPTRTLAWARRLPSGASVTITQE